MSSGFRVQDFQVQSFGGCEVQGPEFKAWGFQGLVSRAVQEPTGFFTAAGFRNKDTQFPTPNPNT